MSQGASGNEFPREVTEATVINLSVTGWSQLCSKAVSTLVAYIMRNGVTA